MITNKKAKYTLFRNNNSNWCTDGIYFKGIFLMATGHTWEGIKFRSNNVIKYSFSKIPINLNCNKLIGGDYYVFALISGSYI